MIIKSGILMIVEYFDLIHLNRKLLYSSIILSKSIFNTSEPPFNYSHGFLMLLKIKSKNKIKLDVFIFYS